MAARGPGGAAVPFPKCVEEIDATFMAFALADAGLGHVSAARVLKVIHGTATKIHVEIEFEDGAAPTKRFWIKTGFENHSANLGQETVYAGEVYFYANLAERWDVRAPQSYFAQSEAETGNSFVIMEDLLAQSPWFFEPAESVSAELVKRAMSALARNHASSWQDPLLKSDAWLSSGGAWVRSNVIGWLYSEENWAAMSALPRWKVLPSLLRDRELLRDTHTRLMHEWRTQASPQCLSHGDCHVGQGYELPNGEVNFLDWQCVMANSWANDVAYFVETALSIDDRRAYEKDVLNYYLAELKVRGISAPAFKEAWDLYRAYAFHGIAWVCCKPELQSEENCAAIAERCAAALVDLDSIAAVHAGPRH